MMWVLGDYPRQRYIMDKKYPKGTVIAFPRRVSKHRGEDSPVLETVAACDISGLTEAQILQAAFATFWIKQQNKIRKKWSDYAGKKRITFSAADTLRKANPVTSMKNELAAAATRDEKIAILERFGLLK
jgi:hypothetical protein